jgi:hypothetical protein
VATLPHAPVTGERWPNLFVVGAQKAGTTSLWRYLGQHPDIYMSPIKEPCFFSQVEPRRAPVAKDKGGYLTLFAGATTEKLVGEASVSYLRDEQAPPAIKRVSPAARIVISLREPLERAYSSYWFSVRSGRERRSFDEAIEAELAAPRERWAESRYVGRGLYCDQIERYLTLFAPNVFILFYEELAREPRREMRALYECLGVDPGIAAQLEIEVHNPFSLPKGALGRWFVRSELVYRVGRSVVPATLRPRLESTFLERATKPEMDDGVRRALTEVYRPEIERLGRLLGRPPPW